MAELNQLYQLVAIADTGTLSKAAEIVHISQPALTRSIQKLEAEWNVTLFDRQKNKITLNQTGELAVQYARRILDDVNTMTDAIQAYERSLHTISIGACAPGPLLELLPELTERFYGMALNSETAASERLLPGLEKGTYQIIITDQEVTAPDILCRPLCTEDLFLTLPPAHPLANSKEGIYLDDLAWETMLLFKEIGIWKDRVISKMPQTNFILQEQDEAFSALIQVSALPAFASDLTLKHSERWAEQTNRLALPILDPEAHVTFYCCVHKAHKAYLPGQRNLSQSEHS